MKERLEQPNFLCIKHKKLELITKQNVEISLKSIFHKGTAIQ